MERAFILTIVLILSGCVSDAPAVMPSDQTGTQEAAVRWEYSFTDNVWKSFGTPPECPLLVFDPPIDVNKATSVLYPGQYRPDYKPHGGFRFDTSDNRVEVRAPFDGYAWRANRRYANGQMQYNIEILHPCGINTRLDHLLELAPDFQKLADTLPAPKEGDSRVTELASWRYVKKGELVATKVGVASNVFMDWGMYDLRAPNEISSNASYAQEQWIGRWNAFYALCWLNHLPEPEKTLVNNLPGADGKMGKTSDYC